MAITKNLIMMMNGTLTVNSRHGKGTEMIVRIPQRLVGHETVGKKHNGTALQ